MLLGSSASAPPLIMFSFILLSFNFLLFKNQRNPQRKVHEIVNSPRKMIVVVKIGSFHCERKMLNESKDDSKFKLIANY